MTQPPKTALSRLNITGFKSFADEVSLDILPGLTGIVGPNGCGKSNIVESLRWVMGESSARALRGGESDDLIFAGTEGRPSRNIAKVTLQLTNARNLAPAPFQEEDTLEITRQAERGSGNLYRINQKIMRAKDVQTIFADLASGSRSSSIISQNRVGELINAKPEERRLLLEEAAGITGLHLRRHDAELKLRQAENNLERVEEHCTTMQERREILAEQSQNALKYRQISENIRLSEEKLSLLTYQRARALCENTQKSLEENQHEKDKIQQQLTQLEDEKAEILKKKNHLHTQKEESRPALEKAKIQKEIISHNLEHLLVNNRSKQAQIEKIQQEIEKETEYKAQLEKEREEYLLKLEEKTPLIKEIQQKTTHILAELTRYRENLLHLTQEEETLQRQTQIKTQEFQHAQQQHRMLHDALEAQKDAAQNLKKQILSLEEEEAQLEAHKKEFADIDRLQEDHLALEKELQKLNATLQEIAVEEEILSHNLHIAQQENERVHKRKTQLHHELETKTNKHLLEEKKKEEYQQHLLTPEQENTLEESCTASEKELALLELQEKEKFQEYETLSQEYRQIHQKKEEISHSKLFLEREKARLTHLEEEKKNALKNAEEGFTRLQQEEKNLPNLENLQDSLTQKQKEISLLQEKISQNEASLSQRNQEKDALEEEFSQIKTTLIETESEIKAIQKTLPSYIPNKEGAPLKTIFEEISCPPEFHKALATALSEELDAQLLPEKETLSKEMIRVWRNLPAKISKNRLSLPCLSDYIHAPPALKASLSAFYLIDETQDPLSLQKSLPQGEALIDRKGNLWRWDGFIRTENAPSSAEIKIRHTQRLQELTRLQKEMLEKASLEEKKHAEITILLKNEEARIKEAKTTLSLLLKQEQEAISAVQDAEKQRDYLHIKSAQLKEYTQSIRRDYEEIFQNLLEISQKITHLPLLDAIILKEEQKNTALTALSQKRSEIQQEQQILQKNYHLLLQKKDAALLQHHHALTQIARITENALDYAQEKTRLEAEIKTLTHAHSDTLIDDIQQKQAVHRHKKEEISKEKEILAQKNTFLANSIKEQEKSAQDYHHTRLILSEKRKNLLTQQAQEAQKLTSLREKEQEARRELENFSTLPEEEKKLHTFHEKRASLQKIKEDLEKEHLILQEKERLFTQEKQALTHQMEIQSKSLHYTHKKIFDLKEQLMALEKERVSDPQHLEMQLQDAQTHLEKLEKEFSAYEDSLKNLALQEETNLKNQHDIQEELQKYKAYSIRFSERLGQSKQNLEKIQNNPHIPQEKFLNTPQITESETKIRQNIEKLQEERAELGAVNLCAEEEFQNLETHFQTLLKEQHDLTEAISRLRKGLHALNKEGRERLTKTFKEIDSHFQRLFTRMFGGGTAYLKLLGSDDPLEAGLEIFAQPPGKKLSSLSLLSGGEQALTALSLIFAAFHCTPAPIYILDEVDAPLDDANVERFCSLLTEMAQQTGTRFLVVTHHQLTMAHMDRLFGVTMQERGVSRLLSVNLSETIHFANG